MARPGWPERNRAARSFRQLRRFHHVINSDKVFGTHTFVYPKNSLSLAENFLNMCFAVPCEDYKINPVLANALDKIFILHADHEQNASTSTVRIAGSSGANPFACIAA